VVVQKRCGKGDEVADYYADDVVVVAAKSIEGFVAAAQLIVQVLLAVGVFEVSLVDRGQVVVLHAEIDYPPAGATMVAIHQRCCHGSVDV